MPTAPQHAIIIGAGMGGLLATRVLADVCAKITRLFVERDALPDAPRRPKGARQGTSRAARGETPGGYYAVCIVSA
jgi:cation diffusion facilitator CzcD-associated flavoprotein CzcO